MNPATVQSEGAILGFDFGKKRIGVAVGQTLTATARPLTTMTTIDDQVDWSAIIRLIKDWQPVRLVVGLPVNMDGSEHALAPVVQEFAAHLRQRSGLPVDLIDERLSSHEAERIAATLGGRIDPRSRTSKNRVDSIAAQLILETWFTQQHHPH